MVPSQEHPRKTSRKLNWVAVFRQDTMFLHSYQVCVYPFIWDVMLHWVVRFFSVVVGEDKRLTKVGAGDIKAS